MRYAVVIEKAGNGFSGYVPDLPGCVAAGRTVHAVQTELAALIPFHLEGLRAGGQDLPKADSIVEWVDI